MDELILPTIAEGEDKSSPFVNCLRNNVKHLRKWAKRTATDCFRMYDREIGAFPIAIDYYAGRFSIHYYAGREESEPPEKLVQEVEAALRKLFGIDEKALFWRTRMRRKPTRQYEKTGESKEFFTVHEYGVKFKINLVDYLDSGLFLDHRETRQWVAAKANGKRLLNLFAYTCSFSVHAAIKGASLTKSVDMSNTYTAWGRENFELNHLPAKNHPIVRADCLKYLDEEISRKARYDLIVIDPPTISRSKKMDQLFDIQVDYIPLLQKGIQLLAPGGIIIFSTNARRFKLDEELFPNCQFREITHRTIPADFKGSSIHRCWEIGSLR